MTGPCVEREAPAKLNLYLEVLGRRPDGFHELVTVLQTLDLCDELSLCLRPRRAGALAGEADVSLRVEQHEPSRGEVPTGPENLVVQAARAVLDRAGRTDDTGVDVTLIKRIPAGGGLGGGSSDAAATVTALDEALGQPLGVADQHALCAGLGSDVPFFLIGGTALATGRGEILRPIPAPAPFTATLGLPSFGLSTPRVYARLDAPPLRASGRSDPSAHLGNAWADADASALESLFRNDLEAPARSLSPNLDTLLREPTVHLSGSGSTVFRWGHDGADAAFACAGDSIRFVRVRSRNR